MLRSKNKLFFYPMSNKNMSAERIEEKLAIGMVFIGTYLGREFLKSCKCSSLPNSARGIIFCFISSTTSCDGTCRKQSLGSWKSNFKKTD